MSTQFPVYLLVLAAFMLLLNLNAGSRPAKMVSYAGIWAACIASIVVALEVYT